MELKPQAPFSYYGAPLCCLLSAVCRLIWSFQRSGSAPLACCICTDWLAGVPADSPPTPLLSCLIRQTSSHPPAHASPGCLRTMPAANHAAHNSVGLKHGGRRRSNQSPAVASGRGVGKATRDSRRSRCQWTTSPGRPDPIP